MLYTELPRLEAAIPGGVGANRLSSSRSNGSDRNLSRRCANESLLCSDSRCTECGRAGTVGAWKLLIPPSDRPLERRRFAAETGGGKTMLSSVNGFAKMELEGGGILPDIKALASENGLNSLPWSKLRPSLRAFDGALRTAAGGV